MPRKKNVTPKTLLQVEVPIPMAGALDLVAAQRDVSRAALVRAILSEFLEIKFGSQLREAMVRWQTYGTDVMNTFLKETVPALKNAPLPEVEPGPALTEAPPQEKSSLTKVEESLTKAFAEENELEAPVVEDDGGPTPKFFPPKYGWE